MNDTGIELLKEQMHGVSSHYTRSVAKGTMRSTMCFESESYNNGIDLLIRFYWRKMTVMRSPYTTITI